MSWKITQFCAYVFGFPIFTPFFRALAVTSLHCLGYGNASSHIYSGEEWFVRNSIARGGIRTCVDVGANTGQYAMILAAHVKGPIYSFEPLSSSFAQLKKNAPAHVRPFRYAISDNEGELTLYAREDKSEQATLHQELITSSSVSETVPLITLDSFVHTHGVRDIDLVKIDTEGHEMEVLKGMQGLLQSAPPRFIQFEFGGAHLRRGHTLYHFQKLLPGYTLFRLIPHGMVRIHAERAIDNFFMFSNIIAVRKKE